MANCTGAAVTSPLSLGQRTPFCLSLGGALHCSYRRVSWNEGRFGRIEDWMDYPVRVFFGAISVNEAQIEFPDTITAQQWATRAYKM
jgi:hypothetical protein